MEIKKIFDDYEKELREVEETLKELFNSDSFLIPLVGRYLLDSGGKRLRPLFLLSSSRFSGYRGNDHIVLASIIELIHMASLLHDDVVDSAQLRRGRPPANSIWGNQVVILVGDFLYSNAIRKAVSFGNQRIMETLSQATTNMTQGELIQLQRSGDIDITEEEYRKIISSKTGILISAACRIGAILGESSQDEENALARFGLKAGTGFQMVDDILDYMADEKELGKKLGKDIQEGKVTLPLICLFSSASFKEKEEVKETIRSGLSDEGIRRIMELFRDYNVIEKSKSMAKAVVEDAKSELMIFPDSPLRDEMLQIADYSLVRQN